MAHDAPDPRAGWESIASLATGGLVCLGFPVLPFVCGDQGLGLLLLWPVLLFMAAVGLFLLGLAGLAAAGVIRPHDRGDTH